MAEFDSVIPAGESGKLTAKVTTRQSQHGKMRKSIAVTTDAPGAENIRLTMSLVAVAPMIVQPRFQLMINAMEGESKTEMVLVKRSDGKPLELTLADPVALDGVEIETVKVTEADNSRRGVEAAPGDMWVQVHVNDASAVYNHTQKVYFRTNHPDEPELSIPMTIRVRRMVEVRPPEVRMLLGTVSHTAERGSIVRVIHNKGQAFNIEGVEVSDPEKFSVKRQSEGPSKVHTFRVMLGEGITAESEELPIAGSIKFRTSDTNVPIIDVPVLIAVQQQPRQRTLTSSQDRPAPATRRIIRNPPGTLVRPTQTPNPG